MYGQKLVLRTTDSMHLDGGECCFVCCRCNSCLWLCHTHRSILDLDFCLYIQNLPTGIQQQSHHNVSRNSRRDIKLCRTTIKCSQKIHTAHHLEIWLRFFVRPSVCMFVFKLCSTASQQSHSVWNSVYMGFCFYLYFFQRKPNQNLFIFVSYLFSTFVILFA